MRKERIEREPAAAVGGERSEEEATAAFCLARGGDEGIGAQDEDRTRHPCLSLSSHSTATSHAMRVPCDARGRSYRGERRELRSLLLWKRGVESESRGGMMR